MTKLKRFLYNLLAVGALAGTCLNVGLVIYGAFFIAVTGNPAPQFIVIALVRSLIFTFACAIVIFPWTFWAS